MQKRNQWKAIESGTQFSLSLSFSRLFSPLFQHDLSRRLTRTPIRMLQDYQYDHENENQMIAIRPQ